MFLLYVCIAVAVWLSHYDRWSHLQSLSMLGGPVSTWMGVWTVLLCNQPPRSTQPSHPYVVKHNEYEQKLECKRVHCTMH